MNLGKHAVLIAAGVAGILGSATLLAEMDQAAVEKGATHFRVFCVNCHGMKADGSGPLAKILKIQPTDLTKLKQNMPEGVTVQELVFRAVDGRHKVGEGGKRDMPVFTDNLEFNTVIEISKFVEAIQE